MKFMVWWKWRWLCWRCRIKRWWFGEPKPLPTPLHEYVLEFAVKNKYQPDKLAWCCERNTSYPAIIRCLFGALTFCEPETIRLDGKNLHQLNVLIPTSPEYGTHVIDPKNPNPIRQAIAKQAKKANQVI